MGHLGKRGEKLADKIPDPVYGGDAHREAEMVAGPLEPFLHRRVGRGFPDAEIPRGVEISKGQHCAEDKMFRDAGLRSLS